MIKNNNKNITKTFVKNLLYFIILSSVIILTSCNEKGSNLKEDMIAANLLGNPDYKAISYGGYRHETRAIEPSVAELKEDMLLINAMGVKVIRTYDVTRPMASNVLKAIDQLNAEYDDFEMYVMLGAWIDCKNAWTDKEPDHSQESIANASEIERAVNLANRYPEIVKIIAVGNEAMVKWAESYYVEPAIILKWVTYLQLLKKEDRLNKDIWVTSSDNFASWGGGGSEYHVADLNQLIKTVDYISMHTYPMHDTHYNPNFWGVTAEESELPLKKQVDLAMMRATQYSKDQYQAVENYMGSLGVDIPIHIGETGWATRSKDFYGPQGSKACDEYKEALYYKNSRAWTDSAGISCFYFQAIDEPWKDDQDPNGSENHFGLLTVDGKAKYVLWDDVDQGRFEGLNRGGNEIMKTYGGDIDNLLKDVEAPPINTKLERFNVIK